MFLSLATMSECSLPALSKTGQKAAHALQPQAEKLTKYLITQWYKKAWFHAAQTGNTTEIQNLISKGIDINVQDLDGYTALMWAASHGYPSIVQTLIDADANVNVQDLNGNTALIGAVRCGDLSIVQKLIDAGANVNVQDNSGDTALMWAIDHSRLSIVQILLDAGANPYIKNQLGQTAFNLKRDPRINKMLANQEARETIDSLLL